MRTEAVVGVEEEEGGVEAVAAEVLGRVAEARPAPDVTPWPSLQQSQGQPREGQAVFHERHQIP